MTGISIIVPVYNSSQYLCDCMESILNSSFKDIEVICIDDCSEDDSINILREYAKQDTRIRVFQNDSNMGAALTRNIGLRYANGKYIQFIDSDDFVDDNTILNVYKQMERTSADMGFIHVKIISDSDYNYGRFVGIVGEYEGYYDGQALLDTFMENNEFFLYLCSAIYRKEFIDTHQLRFQPLIVGEGGDFILRALCQAKRATVVKNTQYCYRENLQSITHKSDAKFLGLLGQFNQYISVLRIAKESSYSQGIEKFLSKQHSKVNSGLSNLNESDFLRMLSQTKNLAERHIMQSMRKSTYNFLVDITRYNELLTAKQVILYGAGYAAKDVICQLDEYDIEIIAVAVTQMRGNRRCILGHKVCPIHELKDYRNSVLIVVTANQKYRDEIHETLANIGFSKVLFLDIII